MRCSGAILFTAIMCHDTQEKRRLRSEENRRKEEKREKDAQNTYAPSAHENPPSTGAHAAWPA